MVVMVRGEVTYACYLTKEEERKVLDYVKVHDVELTEAVDELYADNEIDLYRDADESDYYTIGIDSVEEDD